MRSRTQTWSSPWAVPRMGKRSSLKADRIHTPEARTPAGPRVAQADGTMPAERTYVSPLREKAAARTRALILQHSGYEQAMRQILALRTPETVLKALAQGTRMGNEGQFTVHEAIRKAHRGGHSRPAVVLVRPHRLAHLGDRERLVMGSGRERPLPNGGRHSLLNPGIHGMLRHPTPAEGCTG
jgi:hypothetical protein